MKVGTAMIADEAEIFLHDLVLVDADQRQVRLQDAGEQLALGGDLLVDAPGMVGDVAEEAAQLLRDRSYAALLQRVQRGEQRPTARWNSITSRFR